VLLVLDNPSQFALYIVASQVHQLLEQDIENVAVLLLAQPDDAQREAAQALTEKTGVEVHWGAGFRPELTAEKTFEISYEDLVEKHFVKGASFDMVVLCVDVEPPAGLADLAAAAGVELADSGYLCATGDNGSAGIETTRPGVFVAGCASGPKNIRDSLMQAQMAAEQAAAQLDPRLLQSGEDESLESAAPESRPKSKSAKPPDDMRQQIEQLLYALIDR
jgi:thioredoxin reductase